MAAGELDDLFDNKTEMGRDFIGLPDVEKKKVISSRIPEFSLLPPIEQDRVIKSRMPKPASFGQRLAEFELGNVIGTVGLGMGLAKGAAKGLLSTARTSGAGQLAQRMLTPEQRAQGEALTTARTTPEKIGKFAEQTGEFIVPEAAGLRLSKGARLIPRMATEAAKTGLISSAQTGDPKQAAEVAAIGAAGPVVGAATKRLAGPLRTWAETQYAQALSPTKISNKWLTAKKLLPAPKGMMERGVMGATEGSLRGKVAAELDRATQNLEAAWDALGPDHQQSITPLLNDIHDLAVEKATSSIGPGQVASPGLAGRIVTDPELYKAHQDLAMDIIQRLGPKADEASTFSLRRVRQAFDEAVKGSFAGGDLTGPKKIAIRGSTDAMRNLIAKNPTIAAVNREYSFWRSAQDVLEASALRKVGQKRALTQLARAAGAVAGAAGGYHVGGVERSVESGLMGAYISGKLQEAFQSTAWKTVSSVSMNKVASLLAEGKFGLAAGVATRAVANAALRQERSSE
jgi:hypothetical protein